MYHAVPRPLGLRGRLCVSLNMGSFGNEARVLCRPNTNNLFLRGIWGVASQAVEYDNSATHVYERAPYNQAFGI